MLADFFQDYKNSKAQKFSKISGENAWLFNKLFTDILCITMRMPSLDSDGLKASCQFMHRFEKSQRTYLLYKIIVIHRIFGI
jgi:hypothetical protein